MKKSAAMRIRLDPFLHQEFIQMCQSQDLSAAQVIRELMRNYLSNQKNRDQLDIFLEKQETSHMVDIEKKLPSTNVSDKER